MIWVRLLMLLEEVTSVPIASLGSMRTLLDCRHVTSAMLWRVSLRTEVVLLVASTARMDIILGMVPTALYVQLVELGKVPTIIGSLTSGATSKPCFSVRLVVLALLPTMQEWA